MGISNSKLKFKKGSVQKIDFEFYAPLASQVGIAGSFNDWDATRTPLKRDREGRWKTQVSLAAGRYEYRYLVDGSWQNEQKPAECVPNAFGTWNCVLEVH